VKRSHRPLARRWMVARAGSEGTQLTDCWDLGGGTAGPAPSVESQSAASSLPQLSGLVDAMCAARIASCSSRVITPDDNFLPSSRSTSAMVAMRWPPCGSIFFQPKQFFANSLWHSTVRFPPDFSDFPWQRREANAASAMPEPGQSAAVLGRYASMGSYPVSELATGTAHGMPTQWLQCCERVECCVL
jgi:hypothetical protein